MSGEAVAYGVFRLGSMQLALPLTSLREVVPCAALHPLPCAAAAVAGGLDLRGTVLPVLDLGRLIDRPSGAGADARVVVVVSLEGRLLGLLADEVCGIFDCAPSALSRLATRTPGMSAIEGGFMRRDDNSAVSVLSVDALCSVPGVPMVDDPRATAPVEAEVDAAVASGDDHLVLVRSGDVSFALSSRDVHATVLQPALQASALDSVLCPGTLVHEGLRIPAIDLIRLCGFSARPSAGQGDAFVLRVDEGLVAVVVDAIVDVVRADPARAVPMATTALPRGALFAGSLSLDAMPLHQCHPQTRDQGFYLLLDADALAALPELRALAKLNTPAPGHEAVSAGEAGAHAVKERVLTFDIGVEVAAAVDQISEILPWRPDAMLSDADGPALLVSRGRPIAVWCLSRLVGCPAPEPSSSASVLVVEQGGRPVGFSVSRLVSIDDASARRGDTAASGPGALHAFEHRTVGSGEQARMMSMMDLRGLAASLG